MTFYTPTGRMDITQEQYGSGKFCSSCVTYNIYLLPAWVISYSSHKIFYY